jgi:pimeloyl-ACP methyl ester carboxylesterase
MKIALIILTAMLLVLLIGPLLIPIFPTKGTQSNQSLADPDSLFIEVNNIDVHYKSTGSGEPVFILLHGFGANVFTWHQVMEPLADYGRVIAYDRPAFGLTERPLEWQEDENPYTQKSNIELLVGLMDALEIDQAILVGNSAGGTLGTAFTLAHPERVTALIQVDAAVYRTSPDSRFYDWLIQTPQMNRIAPLILRLLPKGKDINFMGTAINFMGKAWHDPSIVKEYPEIMEGYLKPFSADNWASAFWEYVKATKPPNFIDQLGQIHVPTLVTSGDDDQIVPLDLSIRLSQDIPGATLAVLENCGHMPQEECPEAFMEAVDSFISTQLKETND